MLGAVALGKINRNESIRYKKGSYRFLPPLVELFTNGRREWLEVEVAHHSHLSCANGCDR